MAIYTSYFYAIRFFKPHQIPISTACFDPKWFHDFKDQKHVFLDKRHVLNGLRAEFLHPDHTCQDLCRGPETCKTKDPSACQFLKAYRAQLAKIDKEKLAAWIQKTKAKLKKILRLDTEPELIFIVHEPPYKTCSERNALQALLECEELDPKVAQREAELKKQAQLY